MFLSKASMTFFQTPPSTVSMPPRCSSDGAVAADVMPDSDGPAASGTWTDLRDSRSTLLDHFKKLFSKPLRHVDAPMKEFADEDPPSEGDMGDDEGSHAAEGDAPEEDCAYDKMGVFIGSIKGNSFLGSRTQERKKTALEARSNSSGGKGKRRTVMLRPAAAPKISTTPKISKTPKTPEVSASKLANPRKAGPTSETPPRCELTAFDETGKRVRVFSTTNPKMFKCMDKAMEEMRKKHMSKAEIIAMRDSLMKNAA